MRWVRFPGLTGFTGAGWFWPAFAASLIATPFLFFTLLPLFAGSEWYGRLAWTEAAVLGLVALLPFLLVMRFWRGSLMVLWSGVLPLLLIYGGIFLPAADGELWSRLDSMAASDTLIASDTVSMITGPSPEHERRQLRALEEALREGPEARLARSLAAGDSSLLTFDAGGEDRRAPGVPNTCFVERYGETRVTFWLTRASEDAFLARAEDFARRYNTALLRRLGMPPEEVARPVSRCVLPQIGSYVHRPYQAWP